jgi:hypothetical protein
MPALVITVPPARLTVAGSASETARIRTHLAIVEAELRRKDVAALTPAQHEARARNLDVLHEYWIRGVFPVNTDFPGQRVPYFVDRYGTRCAMAYLIEQSGHGGLVARIATTHNTAHIGDLKDDAELVAWLRQNGLTAAEAARIQPSYENPFADFAGRWEGKAVFAPKDTAVVPYVLTDTGDTRSWTLTFPSRDPVPIRVVTAGGDSLVTEAGPLASILGPGRQMTRLRTILHYGGNVLTGTVEVRYASGRVVRGKTEAALECPGPASPEDVVTFVRGAHFSRLRCVTAIGPVLERQGIVFRVTYGEGGHLDTFSGFPSRIALRWRGRVGWILDDWTPVDPAAPERPIALPSPPGGFRVHPDDSLLVTPAFLRGMTALGLRLAWAKTLLRSPHVPRFVLASLIAALTDTTDEALAALLVSAPPIARDPELLAVLARLPVPRDSVAHNSDGGIYFVTVSSGYGPARNTADDFLWKQSLSFIASPKTPPDALLAIATWNDRHPSWCPNLLDVFEALLVRATRDRNSPTLAALARARPCRWGFDNLAPLRARAAVALDRLVPVPP